MTRTITIALMATVWFSGTSISAAEIKEGSKAPTFELTNSEGGTSKLSDFTEDSSVVLVFSRAHWCPYCMGQTKLLQKAYDEIQEAGAEVVVVYREEKDGVEGLKQIREITGAKFPLLLDLNNKQTGEYSKTGYTTYVIDSDGKVTDIIDGIKTQRPTVKQILTALES